MGFNIKINNYLLFLNIFITIIFIIIYMFLLGGFINVFNFQGLKIFNQINSIMFFEKFSIIMLKIILINFFNMVFILIVIFSSLILLYFYLSRIYFFLRNIPSLKINFNINLFSIKKIIYIISLTYINIILILQI